MQEFDKVKDYIVAPSEEILRNKLEQNRHDRIAEGMKLLNEVRYNNVEMNDQCPCGSGVTFRNCCRPLIRLAKRGNGGKHSILNSDKNKTNRKKKNKQAKASRKRNR